MAVQGDAPFFPDTWLCDSAYGTSLKFDDCLQALRLLPDSTQPTSYSLNSNDQNPHSIPFSVHHGQSCNEMPAQELIRFLGLCHISVEAAGPRAQGRIELVPYYFRGMAARVMQNCVVQKSGLGGFETYSLANLVHYILDRENFLNSFPTSNLRRFMHALTQVHTYPFPSNSRDHYLLHPYSKWSRQQISITG